MQDRQVPRLGNSVKMYILSIYHDFRSDICDFLAQWGKCSIVKRRRGFQRRGNATECWESPFPRRGSSDRGFSALGDRQRQLVKSSQQWPLTWSPIIVIIPRNVSECGGCCCVERGTRRGGH